MHKYAASLQFGFFVMPYASPSAYVAIRNAYSLPSAPLIVTFAPFWLTQLTR